MMDSHVCLVTGASDGIGKHTAMRLAQTGATVLMHGRNPKKLSNALSEIARKTGNSSLEGYTADLSSLSQVRALSEEIHSKHRRLDVLVNNAGVFMIDRIDSEDGYEMTFAVNVLAPFLLTSLLMDLLQTSESSRIIHVSSALHREYQPVKGFEPTTNWTHSDGRRAYVLSKVHEVMFTYKMADLLQDQGNISVNCLHPGRVNTKLLGQAWKGKMSGIPVEEADFVFRAATDPRLDGVTGRYFEDDIDTRSSDITYNKDEQNRLWDILVNLTGAVF
ncbi:dehydrogenase/reductase SDR family member on chromosome X-like [Acanthaster planci]|uniref:Dehydrogenase/reductase SDR family member on chromosome X-like n=1 Tax=Acanthaster planci TaxID=133434 RepID=A0A8B7ZL95_ACAPL|nr:dehydrogenase/reductase SDR family member on chromosome X-like [Acanthaster planci]